MATNTTMSTSDPFADPDGSIPSERDVIVESTLAVGVDASLTLGTDSLIVLDEGLREQPRSSCGITLPIRSKTTSSIPYYNILSATLTATDITIRYAKPSSSSPRASLQVRHIYYSLLSPSELAEKWTSRLIDRAYGPAQLQKRIKVLINPYGGAGRAPKLYQKHCAPIFDAAQCEVDVEQTMYQGHAREIAENLDIDAYDVLACASGDGLPMESFNGLGRKKNASEALRKVAVVQIPCGTGNAMSWNLCGSDDCSMAALCIVKGVRTPLDLVSITQESTPTGSDTGVTSGGVTRTLSFLSQSIGIVAESDLGTENIRWLGDLRFTYGILVRLLGKTLYPVDISVRTEVESKDDVRRHYAQEMSRRKKLNMGSQNILDKELEATTGLGLPPLRYGTIADPLTNTKDHSENGWSPLQPYLNLGNFYCGNMCHVAASTPFFPASLPNDGMVDLVTIDGDISRMAAVKLLLDVENGRFFGRETVRYRKVTGVRVVPRFGWDGAGKHQEEDKSRAASSSTLSTRDGGEATAITNRPTADTWEHERKSKSIFAKVIEKMISCGSPSDTARASGFFSVDGEKLPFRPFQIEVHRGLGTVLSRRWGRFEYEDGPDGWKDFDSDPSSAH